MEREEFKLSEVGFLNHLPNAISSSIAVSYRNLLNKCVLLAMSKYVITSSVAERYLYCLMLGYLQRSFLFIPISGYQT
jgi:hypothetical protein